MIKTIPSNLMKDRYWAPVIHLFTNQSRLRTIFTAKYFDLDNRMIDVVALKKYANHCSHSEKIMLRLSLYLFNEQNKFTLSNLDYLDDFNKKLALEAIKIRFF